VRQCTRELFLTPSDVLARLRANVKTLYRLTGDGERTAVRVGRQWRVRPRDLESWLRDYQNGVDHRPDRAWGTPGSNPGTEAACRPSFQGAIQQGEWV